jgi:hypothetical protein
LIVVTILPLIVGALSLGLISVFSLQSGVSNRLADTGDSQVIDANYQNDIQGASEITTSPNPSPSCGPATGSLPSNSEILLSMLSQPFVASPTNTGYDTVITYVAVPVTSGTSTTYSLERLYCDNDSTTAATTSYLAYDLQAANPTVADPAATVNVTCASGDACTGISSQYISAAEVANVKFNVTEPKTSDAFELDASPVAATSVTDTGSPTSSGTQTVCEFAAPNTGAYSSNLCFVDFSVLNGAALTEAESAGSCLEMSVSLPNNYTLYFCVNVEGSPVSPSVLPTYPEAFLGNEYSYNGTNYPFYTGVSGDPALYQLDSGGLTTITFSDITVVNAQDVVATGWEATSADAESSDSGEYIKWTTNVGTCTTTIIVADECADLNVIPNNEPQDTNPTNGVAYSPVGNACQYGAGLTGTGTTTVECNAGSNETGATKSGATMVEADAPSEMQVTMKGNGLEAITFGLLLS